MPLRIAHTACPEAKTYVDKSADGTSHPLVRIDTHICRHEFFVHWEEEPCHIKIGRFTSIAQGVHFFAGANT